MRIRASTRRASSCGDPLHGAARLDVGVEQVAGDEEQVDLLGEGEVHGGDERGELALALGGRGVAEVGVAGAEVHVRGVQQSKHAVRLPPWSLRRRRDRTGPRGRPLLARDRGVRQAEPRRSGGPVAPGTRLRSGRPHRSRLATPSLGGHCDRLGVTLGRVVPAVGACRRGCNALQRAV